MYGDVFKFDDKVKVQNVKWNDNDSDTFIVQSDDELIPFIFIHQSINEPFVS